METEDKKINEYYVKIVHVLIELLSGEKEDNLKINTDEFFRDGNFGQFIHALSLAGTVLCRRFIDQDMNELEYNHLCNRIIFQYSKKKFSRRKSDENPE